MINLTGNTFRSKDIDFADFDQLIYRSVEIKKRNRNHRPKGKNLRKALNFGHGHALRVIF
jgi:3-dehydroquinate synthase